MPSQTPVVIVASFTAKPDSVDAVRAACTKAIEAVHDEPGCELYSLHQTGDTFVFIEQWADADALQAHSTAPAVRALFGEIKDHLVAPGDIKMMQPIPAGDPAKGRLRG